MGNHLISRYLRYLLKEVSMFQKEVSKHIFAQTDAKKLAFQLGLDHFEGLLTYQGFYVCSISCLENG